MNGPNQKNPLYQGTHGVSDSRKFNHKKKKTWMQEEIMSECVSQSSLNYLFCMLYKQVKQKQRKSIKNLPPLGTYFHYHLLFWSAPVQELWLSIDSFCRKKTLMSVSAAKFSETTRYKNFAMSLLWNWVQGNVSVHQSRPVIFRCILLMKMFASCVVVPL